MKIDAHQHFWNYGADAADYGWMGEGEDALRRDFLPRDLAPLLAVAGYAGCVAVQAREVEAETSALLRMARGSRFIRGVVGWIDLCAPDVEARLDRYADDPLLCGLRMVVHDRPDVGFAGSASHVRGVSCLGPRGLTYDLLVRSEHLPAALALVDACPEVRFVVDHLAKPRLDGSDHAPWSAGIAALGRRPNVWCKLSGLGTLPGLGAPGPFLDEALASFGPSRCMIGSDWPVSTLAADYESTMAVVERWCSALSAGERAMVLGGSCAAFYGLAADRE
ncbi:amidohydrolase family protein [Lichenibacterium dinghuense]|uniref:amidohydrolase family protein n=1 Tax=Lichenibacterium dinghuense TaxID=2895977 RepID=UPI001F234B80|nr:amidohydrolase family protein [Lichenibacterium sp. 6Y81]